MQGGRREGFQVVEPQELCQHPCCGEGHEPVTVGAGGGGRGCLLLQPLSSLPNIIAHLRTPGWGDSDWLVLYDIMCALDIRLGCCHDGICDAILLYSNECP